MKIDFIQAAVEVIVAAIASVGVLFVVLLSLPKTEVSSEGHRLMMVYDWRQPDPPLPPPLPYEPPIADRFTTFGRMNIDNYFRAPKWDYMFSYHGVPVGYDGSANFNAQDNVTEYAGQYLWPYPLIDGKPSSHRAPCGGEALCDEVEGEWVNCHVNVTDCDFGPDWLQDPKLVRRVDLVCSGISNCWADREPAERCCAEVSKGGAP